MFEQKPLTHYTLPRYGRTNSDSFKAWAAWLLRRGAGKLAALLLVAGLGLGLGGCGDDEKKAVCEADGFIGCVEEGAEAALYCADGKLTEKSCNAFCREKNQDYDSGYCHAALMPNPCECYYVMADGDIGWEEEVNETGNCQEGSSDICTKLGTYGAVSHCQDGQLVSITCNEWCISNGYQAEEGGSTPCATEPQAGRLCDCGDPIDYTDGDGVDAWCNPEELVCQSLSEVASCVNNQTITETCDAYCARTKGANYVSKGCDNTLPMAERCQCYVPQGGDEEYDVIDGADGWDIDEQEGEAQEAERDEAGGDLESEGQDAETSCGIDEFLGCTSDGTNRVQVCEAGVLAQKSCMDLCPPNNSTQDPLAYGACKEPFEANDPCSCAYAVVDGDADY